MKFVNGLAYRTMTTLTMFQANLHSSNINVSLGTFGSRRTEKISNSTQTGKNVSRVRWLEDDVPVLIPNRRAVEYFVTGSSGMPAVKFSILYWTRKDYKLK